MGIQIAKSINEMNMLNRRFYETVKILQTNMLRKMADTNLWKSRIIVEKHDFKETLFSSIQLKPMNIMKFQVIASAPHAKAIEEGLPPEGPGWYYFVDHPLLEEWVINKLSKLDPEKAEYFRQRHAVLIGMEGFPAGHPAGLRFMERGILESIKESDVIIGGELNKINLLGAVAGLPPK